MGSHAEQLLECTFCQNAPKLNSLILRGNGILMTYTPEGTSNTEVMIAESANQRKH
jgi:hypothetical protein